jgi:hypothetical protein
VPSRAPPVVDNLEEDSKMIMAQDDQDEVIDEENLILIYQRRHAIVSRQQPMEEACSYPSLVGLLLLFLHGSSCFFISSID